MHSHLPPTIFARNGFAGSSEDDMIGQDAGPHGFDTYLHATKRCVSGEISITRDAGNMTCSVVCTHSSSSGSFRSQQFGPRSARSLAVGESAIKF
jgi:hypothetical protein